MGITLNNITKCYEKNKYKVMALENINLEIEEGEFIAIMGTSGAGKSTLLNILGCIDIQTSGTYHFFGKDIGMCTAKELAEIRNSQIGFILQDFGLISYKTVYDNVAIPLQISHKKRKQHEMQMQIKKALERVGILNLAKRKPSELSGGQKQRVAIARAIVQNPKIILADEPTGNLDKKTSEQIMEQFVKLNKMGTTILIVTHDIHIAEYCEKIITIEDGKINNWID